MTQITLQPTGIPSFDVLLHGGIPMGSTILVAGPSGAGKTMFCTHWLFAGFAQHQEKGLYISLTEPISKLVKHQAAYSFFSETDVVQKNVSFEDLRILLEHDNLDTGIIEKEDIRKIVDRIGTMVMNSGAKRVIIDSITALCYRLEHKDLIRHFIFSLGTVLAYLDVTVLLTSEAAENANSVFGVEEFICDGIFRLDYSHANDRSFRIIKLRGHEYNAAPTKFSITKNGLLLYPLASEASSSTISNERQLTGIHGLNSMTNGGFMAGSAVLLAGPSGVGKSIVAMHAVEQALSDQKKVLYVSFDESSNSIVHTAANFGWSWQSKINEGVLRIAAVSPADLYLDAHIVFIQNVIKEQKYTTVILDSMTALQTHFASSDLYNASKLLINFCKSNEVTLFAVSQNQELTSSKSADSYDVSALFDAIVSLRYIEIDSQLRHGILLTKMRGVEHVKRMMELTFTSHGAIITDGFSGYDGVISGTAHKVSNTEVDKLLSLFLEEFGTEGEALFAEQKAVGFTTEQVTSFVESLEAAGIMTAEQKAAFLSRAINIIQTS